MILRNSLNFISQFFQSINKQIRNIYLNSRFYDRKISKVSSEDLIYKPSPHLLSSLIKYQSQKININDVKTENLWKNQNITKDNLKKLNNFYWFFGLDLKSSKKDIQKIFDKMETAHQKRDPTDEARLDADFHLSIIESSHNVIMLHMMRSMYELLRNGVFYNRQKMFQQRTTRFELLTQHEVINSAIQKRDPTAARQAVEAHLDYVARSQKNQRNSDKNEKTAKQRFEREKLRR